ncbi:MAG: L-alanine-DL-glutamate epimerase-like enolase superfamily enzyme [Planctomycetota bacterium]|jgi:L-alanine-DL-glutamate epimerase-like enolase superfamily enzyme
MTYLRNPVRITEVHIYQKDLVLTQPYTMAGVELHKLDSTIVKLVADNGLTGWGESCPVGPTYQPEHAVGTRAALKQMAPALIGQSGLTTGLVRYSLDARLNGHHPAKAVIDMAVMDLIGKHYKTRVCDLLGGARQELLPSYFAVGINDPAETARIALDKVLQGYPRLQLKCGGRDVQEDIAAVHKVFEVIGNKARIVIDANRSLSMRDALLLSSACRDIPLVLEQPCNTMDEVIAIKSRLSHPVYLDENIGSISDLLRAISQQACDGFGLKVTRLGGLNPMATVRDICAARSMPHSCDDSSGGDIIAAACLHIGATVKPELLEGVWIGAPYYAEHYDPENPVEIVNGHIKLPEGFGLGVNPDASRIGKLETTIN